MADFPFLPLSTDAYLSDTRHLTTLEHGAYFLLLMEAWRRPTCSLPDDDRLLARLAGLTPEQWGEVREIVLAFWSLSKGQWKQKRLAKERAYLVEKSAVQRGRAVSGWKKRKSGDAQSMPDASPDDAPTPTPTPARKASPSKRGTRLPADWKPEPDEGVREGVSSDWLKNQLASFRDYWTGKAGSGATKVDWQATWRNWIRTAKERQGVRSAAPVRKSGALDELRRLQDGE